MGAPFCLVDHTGRLRLAQRFADLARRRFPTEVRQVILYGSVARGDDRTESDIDVLVLWQGRVEEARDHLVKLACDMLLETGEYVSVKVAKPEDFEEAVAGHNPFAEAVRAEGRALA